MRTYPALAVLVAASVLGLARPAEARTTERLNVVGVRSAAAGAGAEVMSGELLVRFSSAASEGERTAALASVGARIIDELESWGWTYIGLSSGMSVGEGLERVGELPGVLVVQPNHVYRPGAIANDPYFWTQYHLDITNTPGAWDTETGSSNKVTVVVVDTGIDASHPDLSGKLLAGSRYCTAANCATVDDPPTPACNHATRVAGVAAAAGNNSVAVAGASWGARLLSLRVFDPAGCTTECGDKAAPGCITDELNLAQALDYARLTLAADPGTYGRVVVNMSVGDDTTNCVGGSIIDNAITNAWNAGVLPVLAAGNANQNVSSPADCSGAARLLPVGATDRNDSRASFSNFGAELANNGVSAPGVDIVTTDVGGKVTGAATGTSFSTPYVAGVAALLLAADNTLTPAAVRTALRAGVKDLGGAGNDNFYGAGRVNACKALKSAWGQPDTCGAESGLPGYAEADAIKPFPNPLRLSQRSTLTIHIPEGLKVGAPSVKIFTMDGVLIRSLSVASDGDAVVWDAKNAGGREVATGVYLILVKSAKGSAKGRVAVIR